VERYNVPHLPLLFGGRNSLTLDRGSFQASAIGFICRCYSTRRGELLLSSLLIFCRCYSTGREGAIALFQGVDAYRTGQEPAGQERTSRTGKDQQDRKGPAGQERTSRTGKDQQDWNGPAGQEWTSFLGQERTDARAGKDRQDRKKRAKLQ